MFNPSESIDFNGNTGPFIQYSYARIKSVLQKKQNFKPVFHSKNIISSYEKELLKYVLEYPMVIFDSGNSKNPSILANYIYQLAKLYNKFYQKIIILDGSKDEDYRLTISKKVAGIIKEGMSLLGIEVPERM
jgi:arginyl-tRNA synthetase